jgi:hypothetical protein
MPRAIDEGVAGLAPSGLGQQERVAFVFWMTFCT